MCLYAFFYLLAVFSSETSLVAEAIEIGFPRKARHERDYRCQSFSKPAISIEGDDPHIIASHNYPEMYPDGIDCVRIINAQNRNEVVILDFIGEVFHIEADGRDDVCTYDFLEVRDGPYGYSPLIGIFCGNTAPLRLKAPSGSMWLRFKTDHGLSFEGFKAKYTFVPITPEQHKLLANRNVFHCKISFENVDGHLGTDQLFQNFKGNLQNHTGDIDCVWAIDAHAPYYQIRMFFPEWTLAYPNHCDVNFMEVYYGTTASSQRVKKLCGKTANKLEVRFPKIYIRLFLKAKAVSKTYIEAIYGVFVTGKNCSDTYKNMFQCKDDTCIPTQMRCNGRVNCVYQDDEKDCNFKAGPTFTFTTGPYLAILVIILLIIVIIIVAAIVLNLPRFKQATTHAVERSRASIRRLVGGRRGSKPAEKILDESPETNHAPSNRRGRRLSSLCSRKNSLKVHSAASDYTFVPGPYDVKCSQATGENVHAALSQKGYRLPYNIRNPMSTEELEAAGTISSSRHVAPDVTINGFHGSSGPRRKSVKRVSFTSDGPSEAGGGPTVPHAHDMDGATGFIPYSPTSPDVPSATFPSDDSSLHRLSLECLDNIVHSSEADEDVQSTHSSTGVYVFRV